MQRTHHLLRNHATHTNAYDMQFTFARPANMVEDFDDIFGHFRRRVAEERLIRFANTPVVEDQEGITVRVAVG